jgi:hypothetical protein
VLDDFPELPELPLEQLTTTSATAVTAAVARAERTMLLLRRRSIGSKVAVDATPDGAFEPKQFHRGLPTSGSLPSCAMPEHVHVHTPHELTETSERVSGRERWFELAAVLLLSLATVGIAWSGYQAARWSGIQARSYAEASTARAQANRAATLGGQLRIQDLLNFNRWLEVSTEGNTKLADLYVRRFRPEFRPAFDAWLVEDPLNNNDAVATPLLMPQYKLADVARADRLERVGDRRFEQGKSSTEHADAYIFATVFFATVLFFAGISMRFVWAPMRATVLGLGALSFLYAALKLLTLPAH